MGRFNPLSWFGSENSDDDNNSTNTVEYKYNYLKEETVITEELHFVSGKQTTVEYTDIQNGPDLTVFKKDGEMQKRICPTNLEWTKIDEQHTEKFVREFQSEVELSFFISELYPSLKENDSVVNESIGYEVE